VSPQAADFAPRWLRGIASRSLLHEAICRHTRTLTGTKVFWFFFSKKNIFLYLATDRLRQDKAFFSEE
jgi:hypothetical protein